MDIQLVEISKRYNQNQVLKNISFTFVEGRRYCIMGTSGIGKTTLLHILMGLVKQDSGQIFGIGGRKIAAVFQEERLIEHLDALENVKLVCDRSVTVQKIEKDFELVGLVDYNKKPVNQLSGGMRRRVAIVRAMLAKSNLIIMDEPFKGLDETLKVKVIEYVKTRTAGKMLLMISHEIAEVQYLEAELIMLDNLNKINHY